MTHVRPAVLDDFIRKFLIKVDMPRTLDAFNTEWYVHVIRGGERGERRIGLVQGSEETWDAVGREWLAYFHGAWLHDLCGCVCRYELQSKGKLSEEYTSAVPDIYLRNQVRVVTHCVACMDICVRNAAALAVIDICVRKGGLVYPPIFVRWYVMVLHPTDECVFSPCSCVISGAGR